MVIGFVLQGNESYTEILIRAPDDIQLSGAIRYESVEVENGSLVQFHHQKRLWQLLFAPERTGLHELIVYARKVQESPPNWDAVVKFNLNVKELQRPIKFPVLYNKFRTTKCQIYTPIEGVLKKDSIIPIHCIIPGARSVNLTVDSRLLAYEGYRNPILKRQITTESKDVVIYGKYGQSASLDGLIKYTVSSS